MTLKESREIYNLHMKRRREHPTINSRPLKPLKSRAKEKVIMLNVDGIYEEVAL
jgi:hypothetical protein